MTIYADESLGTQDKRLGEEIIKEITDKSAKWNKILETQFEKVRKQRQYVYDTQFQKDEIKGRTLAAEKFTLNMIRTPTNRVKTDFRDEQPRMKVEKKDEKATDEEQAVFQHLFDTQVMNRDNVNALYDVADSIIDLSVAISEVSIEYETERFPTMDKKVVIRSANTSDLDHYFFDVECHLRNINREGRYQGRISYVTEEELLRMKDINGKYIKIPNSWYSGGGFTWKKNHKYKLIDYYERYYKEIKLGHYMVPGNPVPVQVDKALVKADSKLPKDEQQYADYVYLGNKMMVDGRNYKYPDSKKEVYEVHYFRFFNDYLIKSDVVAEGAFPFLINFGVLSEDYLTQDPILVPFYDHVLDTQKLMDYSTSSTVYALQMSTLGTKYMIPDGMLTTSQLPHWQGRNTGDGDLPYTVLRDQSGNPLPIKPEVAPGPQVPVIAEYLMQNSPSLINSMLGTSMEQDVSFNTSGEAIRQRRLIQSKSAKIYKDYAFQAFVDAGERIKDLIPFAFNNERYISINKNGVTDIVPLNKQTGTEKKLNDIGKMQEFYNISIGLGSTMAVRKEKTQTSLQTLYSSLDPQLASQIQAATVDIYASSLDFPQSDEVARRVAAFVDPQIIAVGEGKMTVAQYQDQQAQQQEQAQANDPATKMMDAKLQAELMRNQTHRMEAEVEQQKDQLQLQAAQEKAQATAATAHASIIKANAEIGKHLTDPEY